MATEKLVESLARQIDRRNFLKKLGASTVGALLALMGLSQTAFATVSYACCNLCHLPRWDRLQRSLSTIVVLDMHAYRWQDMEML
ncbi:MAG: hypothetical protein C4294_17095 [Nitrospiraceae bacterium]